MSENNANPVQVEGTQFYRRSNLTEILRIVAITLIVFCMVSFLFLWFVVDSGARQAYKEARDVRKALRAAGTEYCGEMRSIYDPNSANGMVDGAAELVAFYSQRQGTVILYEWDDKDNGPLKFEYRKGLYQVVYTDTGAESGIQSGVEGNFSVYYSFELLKYEAE